MNFWKVLLPVLLALKLVISLKLFIFVFCKFSQNLFRFVCFSILDIKVCSLFAGEGCYIRGARPGLQRRRLNDKNVRFWGLKSKRGEKKNLFIMPFCRELCVIKWWACCLGRRRRGGAGWLATSPQPADRSWISPIRCMARQSGVGGSPIRCMPRQSGAWLANQVRGSPIRCVARLSGTWYRCQYYANLELWDATGSQLYIQPCLIILHL